MADESALETQVGQLTKRIDDQARFTRTVVVVCTTAILGVMFYMLTVIFSDLSYVFIARYMENLDKIAFQWKAITDRMDSGQLPAPAKPAAATPAAAEPAAK